MNSKKIKTIREARVVFVGTALFLSLFFALPFSASSEPSLPTEQFVSLDIVDSLSSESPKASLWSFFGVPEAIPFSPDNPMAMDDEAVAALEKALYRAPFRAERTTLLSTMLKGNKITAAQAQDLLKRLDFDEERLGALEVVLPHLLETESPTSILNAFELEATRTQAKKRLHRFAKP